MAEKTKKESLVAKAEDTKTTPITKPATFFELFSEADILDYGLMALGTIGAVGTGAALPVFCILFGQILDNLNKGGDLQEAVDRIVILFIILAGCNLVVSFFQVVGWTITGERQAQKFRTKYVRAVLSQEIGW
jgi:ATP-binding cassette, subfamily B (MDR/TAP), member 1